MSNDATVVGYPSAASIVGEISSSSLLADVSASSGDVLGDVEIRGVTIINFDSIPPATTDTIGGVIVGENLAVTEEGVLSVPVASTVEQDNTRPITAAAVYTEVGNINALLAII